MKNVTIRNREIGPGKPVYIIAEMSANHGQDKEKAKEIIHAMKESGADAVKLQTYSPETITIECRNKWFTECLDGTIWEGQSLWDLYGEAYMPWDWQPELKELAESLGMDCFSTAIDNTGVDFLEKIGMPAMKNTSFELVHLPLIRRMAKTGKPLILSTGMATEEEIQDAVMTAKEAGAAGVILLKCTSAYPAKISDANLKTIPDIAEQFDVPVGVSDHTQGSDVPVTAVTLGACVIEKHFILDREKDKGPDSPFSMEPDEFKEMVDKVRAAEKDPSSAKISEEAIGEVKYGGAEGEKGSKVFRPSVFIVKDVKAGEELTEENARIIRPGYGLMPKEFDSVLGKKAKEDIEFGTPLTWELIEK